MDTISNRIKKAMRLKNIKQTKIVEKTGINKGSLSSYISGRYEPKQNNIYLIAKALEVSPAWLMGYDVPMNEKSFEYNPNEPIEIIIPLDNEHKPTPDELASCIELAKQILNLPEDKKIMIKQLTNDFTEMQKIKKDDN